MQEMLVTKTETTPEEKRKSKLTFLKNRKESLLSENAYDGKYDEEIKRLEELSKNELAAVQTKRTKEA